VPERESGFTEYYFHGVIEHISLDHVAIQRLRKYHLVVILVDMCVFLGRREN
jgi:hypothetical protein